MIRSRKAWLAVGAGLLLALSAPMTRAQKDEEPFKLPDGVEAVRDVEFGKGGQRALKLHIIRPKQQPRDAMPVLVWVHGGGWYGGKKDVGIPDLAPFAERGYFCATIEYRLSGEAHFPAQIEDCKCAIRYLRAKAEDYHIDAERIGVWGESSGGHLVALLGTADHVKELEGKGGWADFSSRVSAVCVSCGPSDLVKISAGKGRKSSVAKLLGGLPSEKTELLKLANPTTHITKKAPPFLIVHGDRDKIVPLEQSEILHAALKKAGVRVIFHLAKDQGHPAQGEEVARVVREFFDRELKVSGK